MPVMATPLPILYQDQSLVVVNKPAGLLVHRTLLDRFETEAAVQLVRDQLGLKVYPVHRLDRPTSGALIFALSSETAKALGQQFTLRMVKKHYLAIVRGVPSEQRFTIDYPLKEELDDIGDKQASREKPAQSAVTEFERLATRELEVQVDRYPTSRYSLVKASLITGRKHQIRRHLRHAGHPIIGDITHGVGKHNRFFEQHFKIRRLLLACTEISLSHPVTNEQMTVRAPLADDFKELLRKMGWEDYA